MRLMLPVQGSHYKNHWCRKISSTRGTLRGNTISNFEGEEKHMPQLGFLIVFSVIYSITFMGSGDGRGKEVQERWLEKVSQLIVKSLIRVWLFATLYTVAYQAPPSMGFSRQEYWSGLPCPSPGDLPNPGIEPRSPALEADTLTSEPPGKPSEEEKTEDTLPVSITQEVERDWI